MKGSLTYLHVRVLTFSVNISGAKGLSPLDRFLCFSGGSQEERVSKETGVLSFPCHHIFPLPPTRWSGEELDNYSFHSSFQCFTVCAPWLLSSSLACWAINLPQQIRGRTWITEVIFFSPNLVQHLGNYLLSWKERIKINNCCLLLHFLQNLCHIKAKASTFKIREADTMGIFATLIQFLNQKQITLSQDI